MLEVNASELPRVMKCGGSLTAARLVEFMPPENESMIEGTAAHEVVEAIFNDQEPPAQTSNGVTVTDDMQEHAREYVKAVRLQSSNVTVETRVDFWLTKDILVKVKPDAIFWSNETTLCVDDYKYGWREVEVEDNWQLIAGAIGAIRAASTVPEIIITGVYQPRPFHRKGPYRRQVFTLDKLRIKHDELLERLTHPTDELVTGDQCVQCPVARGASCPAWRAATYNAVDVAMRGVSEDPDAETLSRELMMFRRADEVMKQAKQYVEDVVRARLEAGHPIPRFMLERAYGHRYMPDFDAFVEHALENAPDVTRDDLYEKPKPKSPAKLEKLPGINKEMTAKFTKTPGRGSRVVDLKIDTPPPPKPVDKDETKS